MGEHILPFTTIVTTNSICVILAYRIQYKIEYLRVYGG